MNSLSALEPIIDETRRDQIVRRLRALIVNGSVVPGQKLTETSLAQQLGVSRAPLREAIRELVEGGLIESVPYKGMFVRSMTRRDLEELYSLRTILEQFAFRQCWDKRDEGSRENLHERHRALIEEVARGDDPERAIEVELELHSWCYELSRHGLLMKSWKQMKPNLQFYFMMHQKAHNRSGPLREAHDIYVDLATGDDLEAMLDHLNEHMQQGLQKTLQEIELS